ncbi:hypothetical protein [Acidithiobacillus sp.]
MAGQGGVPATVVFLLTGIEYNLDNRNPELANIVRFALGTATCQGDIPG